MTKSYIGITIDIIILNYKNLKNKLKIMNTNLVTKWESPFLEMAGKFFNNDFIYHPAFESRSHGLSNISETDNEYIIELSTPGFKKDDVKIEIENDVLKISSDFEDKKEEKNDAYYKREFYKSSFSRSFTLPKTIKKDEISATMNDGILTVNVPKNKDEKKNENIKITIK